MGVVKLGLTKFAIDGKNVVTIREQCILELVSKPPLGLNLVVETRGSILENDIHVVEHFTPSQP
jgi:hypothetical protein